MGSLITGVLLMTTACGGVAEAEAGAPSSTETQSATPAPENSPTPTADVAPIDNDEVPDAGNADLGSQEQPAYATTALEVLGTIPIKGRAPKTGYDRGLFGTAWADVDHNGCDTRNDILNRDLSEKTFKPGTRDCKVLTGVLADPYTATTISFVRGASTSAAVQIDHVVALSDAWQKGAQLLSTEQRTALANDPLNLLAADGPANQQKSDSDAASWLPPNKSYRCEYVARQISVKATYSLWVTQAEHDAMTRVLGDCQSIEAPTNRTPTPTAPAILPPPPPVEVPAPPAEAPAEVPAPPVQAPVEAPAPAPLLDVPAEAPFYQNCTAVRAAGAAPIYAGQPGFQSKFDKDGDGVGCE